jgi:hypothetical protein
MQTGSYPSRYGRIPLTSRFCSKHFALEYAQALVFDATSCGTGKRFVKFREAPIDFPPTFQYDVLLKYRRRPSKRKQAADEVFNPLSQGPHPEASEGSDAEKRYDGGLGELNSSDDTTGELASVISSVPYFDNPCVYVPLPPLV